MKSDENRNGVKTIYSELSVPDDINELARQVAEKMSETIEEKLRPYKVKVDWSLLHFTLD